MVAAVAADDFSSLQGTHVNFLEHPLHPEAQLHLNNACAGCLDNCLDLFTDPDSPTECKETAVADVIQMIADELILPDARDHTANPEELRTKFCGSMFKATGVNPDMLSRLNKKSMTQCTREICISNKQRKVLQMSVSMPHLCFLDSRPQHLNWDRFSAEPPPEEQQAPPPAPPVDQTVEAIKGAAVALKAQAEAQLQQQQCTPAQFAAAVAQALRPADHDIKTAEAVTKGIKNKDAGLPSICVFNDSGLPSDVRERFRRRRDDPGKPVLREHVTKPHSTGRFCHSQGSRLFLADGTMFFLHDPQDLDSKKHIRNAPACQDSALLGIRLWCQSFTRHSHANGCHVHPLWCFRPDQGGSCRFTAGVTSTDDLPGAMRQVTAEHSNPVHLAVKDQKTILKSSRIRAMLQDCQENGNIVHQHPSFAHAGRQEGRGRRWLHRHFLVQLLLLSDPNSAILGPLFRNSQFCLLHKFPNSAILRPQFCHSATPFLRFCDSATPILRFCDPISAILRPHFCDCGTFVLQQPVLLVAPETEQSDVTRSVEREFVSLGSA